jgi:hypothetical protein
MKTGRARMAAAGADPYLPRAAHDATAVEEQEHHVFDGDSSSLERGATESWTSRR